MFESHVQAVMKENRQLKKARGANAFSMEF
jgi:hypothetical protein